MFPLVPTLALAFVSFISSVFVILRVITPILPPSPLSRRVRPSEFGLPNFGTLSPADKSHVWLASLDIVALAVFVWQAVSESLGGPSDFEVAHDPASAVRLWFSLTLRQSCLLVVASITLLHVRMGRPISFGVKHWVLWAPTLLLIATSTSIAGVLASTGISTFFVGLTAYSTAIGIFSSIAFACLIGTLIIIRHNLTSLHEEQADSWPPPRDVEEKPRPSFGTEEIDALRDGSSWITSDAGSRRASVSAWSYSTHHSARHSNAGSVRAPHPFTGSYPSIPPKSSFWFSPGTPYDGHESPIPPVPPLPSPYRPTSPTSASLNNDPDPFRRNFPPDHVAHVRTRTASSQASWLTSTSGSKATLSAWSFPATTGGNSATPKIVTEVINPRTELLPSTVTSRPVTPAMVNARVLGGYGYSPESALAEKGIEALAGVPAGDIDISIYRAIGWLILIWVPLALSLPYLFTASPTRTMSSVVSVLYVLSLTISSPLLALNLLFRSPLPIPSGLFDNYSEPPSVVMRAPSPQSTLANFAHEYKRSGSVTVVEGRRSTDIWLAKGDAVEGKSKIGRAMEMLHPKPKLSVLPPEEAQDGEITPPLPIQYGEHPDPATVPATPQSTNSAEMGRMRTASKSSSYWSSADDSVAFNTRIMVAQRHYSALATTVVVPPSPKKTTTDAVVSSATGIAKVSDARHLRSRSVSSVGGELPMTPPPSLPLPPTPPSVRSSKAMQLRHRKSRSSGFSMSAIGNADVNEIDVLSAGMLPLLVPGLKVGGDMKIRQHWKVPSSISTDRYKKSTSSQDTSVPPELGGFSSYAEFSSPEAHSTPIAQTNPTPRFKKTSGHKRHHFSLPSLSLGKDSSHSLSAWRADLGRALDGKTKQYAALSTQEDTRRTTVLGIESPPSTRLNAIAEEGEYHRPSQLASTTLARNLDAAPRSRAPSNVPSDVPPNARCSLNTLLEQMMMVPPSAASTATLFDFDTGSGPQAESTPPDLQRPHPYATNQESAPPLPEVNTKANRRSSIVYIKSDDVHPTNPVTTTTSERLARFSSRVVRPLRPKASKIQGRNSSVDSTTTPSGKGLRPLSLLQEVDTNLEGGNVGTPPLSLRKKQKAQKQRSTDENVDPSLASRGLRSLRLLRSDTSKERALLRKEEVLPDVVVRPPSTSAHVGYAYSFHD